MTTLDFTAAQLKHSRWKSNLRSFLDGKGHISESELVSPKDCDLGKWIYAEGLTKYGSFRGMKELERVHSEMHTSVKYVLQKKHSGDEPGAEQEYQKVAMGSDRIVALLTELRDHVA
jgi:methyl-accepting chemotaxis protein